MCAPSAPPPPNYAQAAQVQGQANLDAARATAMLSNPNMDTPYGTRSVTYDGNVPTITDRFSPEGQQQYDTQNRIISSLNQTAESGLNRVSDSMNTPFDTSKVQGYSVSPGVASYNDPTVKALIERNQPEFDRRRSSTEADLLARGFNPGGSGYDARFADIGKQENDMRLAALLAGGQEQSRVGAMESQRRGQDIQEQAYLRQLPLNELNALRTGGMPNLPQFQAYQGAQVGAAPMFDATLAQGNAAQQAYQNKLGSYNNMMGGLFGLGSAAMGIPGLFGTGG